MRRRWWGAIFLACVLVVAAGAGAVWQLDFAGVRSPEAPAQLQVNLMSKPMAVAAAASGVTFSWNARDTRPGQSQSAYEIRVSASPGTVDSGAAVWDSGRVTSADPLAAYRGPKLSVGTRYWWTVRTYDAGGTAGPWASASEFGTALPAAWDAAPIWSRARDGKDSGWAFLRGTVTIAREPIEAATVYATGASTQPALQYVFRLSLNGNVLGVGPTEAPGTSTTLAGASGGSGTLGEIGDPDPTNVNEYWAWDVTSQLKAGKDAFGALAYSTQRQDFELELVVQYANGTRQVWGTGAGTGWQAMDGGQVYPAAGSVGTDYYTAPVENLDAERYPFGFDTPAFDAVGWTAPLVKRQLQGLTPTPTANVRLAAHKPVKITKAGPGDYILDFGTTQVGGVRLTLNGTAGEKVVIRSGEVLHNATSVHFRLDTGNVYQDTWTLRGGQQTLQYWGYRVFRYVEITGVRQPLTDANVAALALVYPDDPGSSGLTSSSEALNEVWEFSKHTIEDLNLDLYQDSPTRERSGDYEGDDYIHQLAQAAVDGDSALARYSTLYALTSMVHTPTSITEYRLLAPLAALASWWQTGNDTQLASLYPMLQQMLLTKYIGPDGLVNMPVTEVGGTTLAGEPTTLVDWPRPERDGFVFSRQNTVVNAYAYASFTSMAQIAADLGHKAEASYYQRTAAKLRTAMQQMLYDPATGAFRDGVGVSHEAIESSVFAVAFGVASPAQTKTAAAWIARRGMVCSTYCAAFLLEALYDGGQGQAALNLMTADTDTSWLHMIALGAGSTMEGWNTSLKPEGTYSHAWSASPAYIVPDYLFGVSALTPGWGSILIRPQPGNLTSGTVAVPTARGELSVGFRHAAGAFTVKVTVPADATAEVALPGVTPGHQVWVDGTATTTTSATVADGTVGVAQVSSGTHTISTSPVAAAPSNPAS